MMIRVSRAMHEEQLHAPLHIEEWTYSGGIHTKTSKAFRYFLRDLLHRRQEGRLPPYIGVENENKIPFNTVMSAGICIAQQCPMASKYVGATSYHDLLRHFPYT